MEWPNQICFSNKEIADIQATLQRREGVPMQVEKELSGFWFHSDNWESELRVTKRFAARIRYRSWSSSAWKRRKW